MMAPEPLCVGVVKTGNSATVSGPQLEVETPHPATARVGWKLRGSLHEPPHRTQQLEVGTPHPAQARVGWKLRSKLSSPPAKAEPKANQIARSGTTMRARMASTPALSVGRSRSAVGS